MAHLVNTTRLAKRLDIVKEEFRLLNTQYKEQSNQILRRIQVLETQIANEVFKGTEFEGGLNEQTRTDI